MTSTLRIITTHLKKIFFVSILVLGLGCKDKQQTASQLVSAYYEGFVKGDYEQIKSTLSDSLVTTEGDFNMPFSRESYYEKFKWDSVFRPVYRLKDIRIEDDVAIAKVAVTSPRLVFLKNSPMTCIYRFQFEQGKIAQIDNLECPDAKWKLWEKGVNELVQWTKVHHPELDGFINDLTMNGAQNYMKAIRLYESRPSSNSIER